MKIAILTPTFSHYSGIDGVVNMQAEEYAKKGNKVTVFALEAEIKPRGFELKVLEMPRNLFLQRLYRLFFFIDFKKINNAAEKLKDYDVVISHFYPMNLIASRAKKKYGIKYIYHNHGVGYSRLFANPLEKIYMKMFAFFNRLSLKNVDSAVSISRFMRNELKKETGLDSKVVYDKIDAKFRKGINGSRIRKKLKINGDGRLLFFIGRLSPHKNIHALIRIFDIVSRKMPKSKLLIIGKPTFSRYYKMLRNNANKNVIFIESVSEEELPYYYAACDLYVTASLWEGFNLPIAEAQACGKKVVAFDICSHPEVVKNGILVKKDDKFFSSERDIEEFANAVIKLLKQP